MPTQGSAAIAWAGMFWAFQADYGVPGGLGAAVPELGHFETCSAK
jgi:hypothetical protein